MSPGQSPEQTSNTGSKLRQRLDKYLWFARVVKTRTLAAKLVSSGNVRVNSERVTSPSKAVGAGDVLTVSLERTVRVLHILAPGSRRGPFEEARLLYDEFLDEQDTRKAAPDPGAHEADKTRPDKRLRRIGAQMKRNL